MPRKGTHAPLQISPDLTFSMGSVSEISDDTSRGLAVNERHEHNVHINVAHAHERALLRLVSAVLALAREAAINITVA